MKKYLYLLLCLFAAPLLISAQTSTINVDGSKIGVEVPKGLWGIFYEEINRAGDGGLWPEMIYNMGFEEKNIPSTCTIEDNKIVPPAKPSYQTGRVNNYRFHHFDPNNKTEGWTLENKGGSKSTMEVVTDKPLNKANLHSLLVAIDANDGGVNLINEGYKGIFLVKGEKYNFEFYVRADKSYKGKVIASLIGKDGNKIFSKEFAVNNSGSWANNKAVITSNVTDNSAKLVLQFTSTGKLWLDWVSLMPQSTFKNHGLRKDIAQTLADMKPAFIRWPGGCIVEGMTMDNRVKWKETIGDRKSRIGQFDLWGYHNSENFGYHDFLQYCEDIGAEGMWVVNAGLSCSFRNGDYFEMNEMDGIIQDVLDGIEYAIGNVHTKWGAVRAKNGHSAPFPLKYVEIGNENFGPKYAERYSLIYDACKKKYPQLTYINNNGLNNFGGVSDPGKIEMLDPHYYVAPETFFNTVNLFDNEPRGKQKVYIGEYAVNSNVGSGTLEGALAEAAFMFGIEKNSDLVKMASYAPLLENANYQQWPTNLIRFKNDMVFGRSSYHVQKMFNENKPDVTLSTELSLSKKIPAIVGKVGFSTSTTSNNSKVVVKDFTIFGGTSTKYTYLFPLEADQMTLSGSWKVDDNGISTGELKDLSYLNPPGLYIAGNPKDGSNSGVPLTAGGSAILKRITSFPDGTISANIQRDSMFSSFSIRFGVNDDRNYFAFTVSNPRMRGPGMGTTTKQGPVKYVATVEQVINGTSIQIGTVGEPFDFDAGKIHNIKVTIRNKKITGLIDDVKLGEVEYKGLQKQYAIAGYDNAKGEVIVKVVNGESTPFGTEINLANLSKIESTGQVITLSSASNKDDNSFDAPQKVSPVVSTYSEFGRSFKMEFKPNSFTILRIKAAK